MDEHEQAEEGPADTGAEPDEGTSPTDAETEAEAEANLLAKIEMNVYGHP